MNTATTHTGTQAISARSVKNGKPTLSKETEKLIAAETKAAERLAVKVRAEKPADKSEAAVPVKVPTKAEPKVKAAPKAIPKLRGNMEFGARVGTSAHVLMAAIAAKGKAGMDAAEFADVAEKIKKAFPSCPNPLARIRSFINGWALKKGTLKKEGDRYIYIVPKGAKK